MDNFSITKLSRSTVNCRLRVYEIAQTSGPALIYFSIPSIPDIADCKVMKSDLVLPEPVIDAVIDVPIIQYAFRTNVMSYDCRLYVHYGMFRAGGFDFSAIDCLASSDTTWLYEYDFAGIDIPALLANNTELFSNYQLLQQLAFTIAEYDSSARRVDIDSQNSTTSYDKLTVSLNLHLNELSVKCTDTAGQSVCTHLSKLSGIAEESVQCAAEVSLKTYATDGSVLNSYNVLIANPDYSDTTMAVALPSVSRESIAGDIRVKYIVEIGTTGDVITVNSRLVLTDEQLANLMLKFGLGNGLDISDLLAIIEAQQRQLKEYVTIEY